MSQLQFSSLQFKFAQCCTWVMAKNAKHKKLLNLFYSIDFISVLKVYLKSLSFKEVYFDATGPDRFENASTHDAVLLSNTHIHTHTHIYKLKQNSSINEVCTSEKTPMT